MDKKGTTKDDADGTDGGQQVPVDEAVITKTSTSTVGAQSMGTPSKHATELNDVDALKQALAVCLPNPVYKSMILATYIKGKRSRSK